MPRLSLLYLFIAALMLRLWYNFGTDHVNGYGAADAAEYLRYATALSKLNFITPTFGPEWKEFTISGPVFPIFLLLCSKLTFNQFDATNSNVFLAAQSIISALTVVLMAWCASGLWNSTTGYWAGYLGAFYPGFIVNTGRLYSETFATFLETAAAAILINLLIDEEAPPQTAQNLRSLSFIILGVLLVLLQLTRSSMILLSIVAIVLVIVNNARGKPREWKNGLKAGLLVSLGMALMLAPWLLFQKSAFNRMSPIVDRVGQYNLFIGTNTETQGYLSYPYPDGRGIENKSFYTLTKEAYKKSPSRFIKLALDKPARLYKFPWNDFRTNIGPLPFQAQVLLHQLIILLSLCGLCLGLTLTGKGTTKKKRINWNLLTARAVLVLLIVLNLPYLAFITVPRYNLLAMPSVIILAAAALTTLLALLRENRTARAPKIAIAAALFLLIYLRDDLKSPFFFGTAETASIYIVQGADRLARSIISSAGAAALFASVFCCIRLMRGAKTAARTITIIVAIGAVALCSLTQRANGRPGEGIITLARPGEKLSGQIFVPKDSLKDSGHNQWFLLIDGDKGQLLKNQFTVAINGKTLRTPFIACLAALDDWHYMKTNSDNTSYLECFYIFDCLSAPASITNSELRQWFAAPLTTAQIAQIGELGYLDLAIEQKADTPSTIFSAAPFGIDKNGAKASLIPARKLYSWEKTFYGVENDAGFTDPRYDEKVPTRKSNWRLTYKDTTEDLADLDANIRLIKVTFEKPAKQGAQSRSKETELRAEGLGDACLCIKKELIDNSKMQLLTVEIDFKRNTATEKTQIADPVALAPDLYLTWVSRGKTHKMPIPGLIKITPTSSPLSLSLPVYLQLTGGSDHQLHCNYPSNSCSIKLSAQALDCHPVYSPQEIF